MSQIAIDDDPDYEVETLLGVTGPAFPVVLQPTGAGCIVNAPADVEYRTYCDDLDGTVLVMLRFKRDR